MPRRACPSNRPRSTSNVLQSTASRFPVSSLHPSTSGRSLHRANQTRPKALDFLSHTEGVNGGDEDENEDDLADGRVSGDDDGNDLNDVIGGAAEADSDDDDEGQDGESSHFEEDDDADADADAPRISQWVDDETLGEGPAEEYSEGTDEDGEDIQVVSVLPFIHPFML